MSVTVCVAANTLNFTMGGGHFWVYLNWALGLRALGCQLIWLERVGTNRPAHKVRAKAAALKSRLERYELAGGVALCSFTGEPLARDAVEGCLDLEAAAEADLLLNLGYFAPPKLVGRFRRSALVDIDPGLLQIWMSKGWINLARHDRYFTTGETVGQPGSRIPDVGLQWQYTPPCVSLDWWPVHRAASDAPFTTVSNWEAQEWVEDEDGFYLNDKRTGFLPFLNLPRRTNQPLELALCIGDEENHVLVALQQEGWRVRQSHKVISTPEGYQRYIQDSLGEFSCAKPSCVRLQNSWISDRTLCYLASGKPAVVQHTGPSRFLPDSAGLFRFCNMDEAARYLERVEADYERQCNLARALAEEYFDARKVVRNVLERALA